MNKQEFIDSAFLALVAAGHPITQDSEVANLWKKANGLYKSRPATLTAAKQRAARKAQGQTPRDERPTAQEVDSYIMEHAGMMFTTGQKFLDYQDQNNWTLKTGNKVKDWRAVIRTWFNQYKERNPQHFKSESKAAPQRRRI